MTLSRLVAALDGARVTGDAAGDVVCIVHDSRAARAGCAFVALRGTRSDGHTFVSTAIAAGARVVVVDEEYARGSAPPAGASVVVVPDTQRALSRLAATFYGDPSASLAVAGVTGTNGKTTTTFLIAAILNAAGIGTARVGTLGAEYREEHWPLANTTPLALELQELLATLAARGAAAVAMEVSSHALALQRVADVRFRVGALTNVTRDHLDFHGSFDAYAAAKRVLFTRAEHSVLNADDALGARWAAELESLGRANTTFGVSAAARVRATGIEGDARGSAFTVDGQRFVLSLPGRFNVSNALAALCVAREFGVDDVRSAAALKGVARVPGRMEREGDGAIDVLIDYAHTPDALQNVLRAARELARGRVTVVFGCGGDRDRGKRAEMGRIAAELADATIVTSDNPRSEDPAAIVGEIVAGIQDQSAVRVELDRRTAIRDAVSSAQKGDVVVVAGKGHEDYQLVGDRVLHFDDREEVRAALALRVGSLRC